MIRRKMTTAGRNVKIAVSLITGMLLAGALAAGSAFAADASSVSDGRDVEITYLNDAKADEEVLIEGVIYAAGFNNSDIQADNIVIEGVEDQTWTGNPVTLPKLKIRNSKYDFFIGDHLVSCYRFLSSRYTVEYEDNIIPGTAKMTITGKENGDGYDGGLSGSVTKTFNIKTPLSTMDDPAVEIKGVADQTWTGGPVTLPELEVWYKTLYKYPASQYTVIYSNNTNPGTASIIITGTETEGEHSFGLKGSITKTFQIIKPEPETEAPQKESETPQESGGIPVATTVISGKGASQAAYTVTSAGSAASPATVAFSKTMAAANAKTIKVPDTVVLNGKTYQVTSIDKKAFSGMKKLKKLTIGANVTSIGASAFAKCTNLKTLIIKSTKLTAAKCKKCLKGSSINTVKVPKSKKKAYKKIFTKKVCGRKVTVK